MLELALRHYWGFSMGEGGRYLSHALQGNFIAIGFAESLGDLQSWEQRRDEDRNQLWESFRTFYRVRVPEESEIQGGIQGGQCSKFVIDMQPGDWVLIRDPAARKVHIAEVAGPYEYVEAPNDGCHYRHRRKVRWVRREIDREQLPERLKRALGSLLTVFALDKYSAEIEALAKGEPPPAPRPPRDLVEYLKSKLMNLTPSDFQVFVGEILGLAGFTVVVNRIVGDKGIDVLGSLNMENLAEVNVRAQVKRIAGNTGIAEIQQLRGALAEDEQGLFVTLGGFTKQAREEAEATGKKKIRLLDGEEFVDLVLRYYDELPPRYKEFLGLRRKEVPLKEQFILPNEATSS